MELVSCYEDLFIYVQLRSKLHLHPKPVLFFSRQNAIPLRQERSFDPLGFSDILVEMIHQSLLLGSHSVHVFICGIAGWERVLDLFVCFTQRH